MTAAVSYAAGFIGPDKAKAAANYAAAAGLEIMKYDPLTDIFYLSDGEAYSSAVLFSCFCTIPN
jgi:hypothetical protein